MAERDPKPSESESTKKSLQPTSSDSSPSANPVYFTPGALGNNESPERAADRLARKVTRQESLSGPTATSAFARYKEQFLADFEAAKTKAEAESREHFEGCGKVGPIVGVFFAEFHPEQGPMVRVMTRSLSKSLPAIFDSISHYIIPKLQLAKRTVTLNALGFKILGYPMVVKDKKYKRNQFMFNVCFVVHPWSRSVHLEGPLIKLSEYLYSLEVESQYLSKPVNSDDPDCNKDLEETLERILEDLNGPKQECNLLKEDHACKVKVIKQRPNPHPVRLEDVPILSASRTALEVYDWDLTSTQILPFIDGVNYVKKIADLAEVDAELVICCVQNLVFHKIVRVVPIFKFSNKYVFTF